MNLLDFTEICMSQPEICLVSKTLHKERYGILETEHWFVRLPSNRMMCCVTDECMSLCNDYTTEASQDMTERNKSVLLLRLVAVI
jgi:hypothetical protein